MIVRNGDASLPDISICRRIDSARHWLATHPPPAA